MIKELIARQRLVRAFKAGDISLKRKVGKETIHRFPRIHSVKVDNERTEYVFTLPNGIDPKEMKKKAYAFKQVLGTNTEIRGHLKRFVINVYKKSMSQKFNYNSNDIDESIKDIPLPIVAGKDIRGKVIAYDMETHPHLLVAGETGSGKSTQLRSILTTLIRSQSPENLRLVLGDLKRSEFHVFRNVTQVDTVATNTDSLSAALSTIAEEMRTRGQLLDQHEKTHISQIGGLQNIIVCIDEVAMLKKEKEIMSIVEDISAIGRALGVYLILSMQRPDRDVLDGKLKNNLTVRMAFRHPDIINSRITIGESGAEKLPSQPGGRMLLKMEHLTEIQAPYLSDDKARKILDPYRIKKQPIEPPTQAIESPFGRLEV